MKLYRPFAVLAILLFISCQGENEQTAGQTMILKWPHGKNTAVSLTYDDGSRNQFRIALPIMDKLDFPATFYINTGNIPGSEYLPKFIGRPIEEIIKETADIPTTEENLFERASAAAYGPYEDLRNYHTQAGAVYESGNVKEACDLIDEAFRKVRNGELRKINRDRSPDGPITWDTIRAIAKHGYEFGSHTITHPRLAVLDEANMLYELEKSKEDIRDQLGEEHTFSAECPYGTEDERVMEYAYKIYPALRNRMPEDWLDELNRASEERPENSNKEYVQWQRGPLTDTPMELMKSWIDTCLDNDNIWLVLVFHGIEGVGWESKTKEEIQEYFDYIKSGENRIWVATFKDVTQYIRERMYSTAESTREGDTIKIRLTHDLGEEYDHPLHLKTYIPESWNEIRVTQKEELNSIERGKDDNGSFIIYETIPNGGEISIARL